MLVGAVVTMAGGLLLASTFVVSPPTAIPAIGLAMFIGGLLVIGIAGGLREAWDAFKAFFP